MTEPAREVLTSGVAFAQDEDEGGDVGGQGRRALLRDTLHSRLRGEVGFLALRLEALVGAMGVHQPLPPVVADAAVYDLALPLLLRALYEADVCRDAISPSADAEAVLAQQVSTAARALGVSREELGM